MWSRLVFISLSSPLRIFASHQNGEGKGLIAHIDGTPTKHAYRFCPQIRRQLFATFNKQFAKSMRDIQLYTHSGCRTITNEQLLSARRFVIVKYSSFLEALGALQHSSCYNAAGLLWIHGGKSSERISKVLAVEIEFSPYPQTISNGISRWLFARNAQKDQHRDSI